jgi:TatD DNase family protein|tara:strand:+ start:1324 stop:2124 length:801 start_codon:yes stop_codon:yes gene_type:complete
MQSNLPIIDSHAHLDYPKIIEQLDDVIKRANEAGVKKIISIGVKLSKSKNVQAISEKYEDIFFSAGIHPHEASSEPDACNLEAIIQAASHPKCVAIGEAGLDYFYDHSPQEAQQDSFRVQIQAARELDLPIIIHSRDADEDMASIIEEEYEKSPFKGVLHCFSSGKDLAKRAINKGFYISFSGILTFPKSTELREIASKVPCDRILVETDAPFLAPVPFRGKTNEPAYTVYTLKTLSEAIGKPFDEMAKQTFQNTLKLFSKIGEYK